MAGKYDAVVIAKGFSFQPDRYRAVTFQVALNQPAAASNGYMRVFVNGVAVIDHRDIWLCFAADSRQSTFSPYYFVTDFKECFCSQALHQTRREVVV